MGRIAIGISICLFSAAVSRAADVPTFEKDILPLLKSRCFSCHGIEQPKGKLDLRTRASMLKGGRNGPALVPGSLKESLIWINVSTDKMPADKQVVTDAEKSLLRRWILAGGPGDGASAVVGKNMKTTGAAGPLKKQGAAAIAALIDAEIAKELKEAKLPVSPQADDAEYLRRVYLDIAGHIPTLEATTAFLASTAPDKRTKLVDDLLASPEYGQQFGNIWAKLITVDEPYLKAGLQKWLTDRFNENQPWDALVRDLVAANGKGADTAFVMSNVDNKVPQPSKLAGSTARLFLGLQLQCAECHNHPFVDWKQTDFWGLAAFFSNTRMSTKTEPLGLGESPPAKAKSGAGAKITLPATAGRGAGKVVAAKFLTGVDPPILEGDGPFRPVLATWMTSVENPFFAPAAANRVWAHFFGRGLVNPIDDLNEDNEPSHPASLQALADEFRASGYDLKHLIRCICATQAYQRSSRPLPANKEDQVQYSHMAAKVMSPEAMYDSLVIALGVKELSLNTGVGATSGSGGNKTASGKVAARDRFITFFSTKDLEGYATDYTHGIPQALSLMNDPATAQTMPVIDKLVKMDPKPEKVVESLYLTLLNRRPTPAELQPVLAYVAQHDDPKRGYAGVIWVLMNTPEFGLIR